MNYRIGPIVSLLVFIGCTSSSSPGTYRLIAPELDLGEYLQAEDAQHIITVSRGDQMQGLVRVNTVDDSIEVLDPDAREAKDIKVHNKRILYRIKDEIYFLGPTKIKIISGVTKLFTFQSFENFGRISFELNQGRGIFWQTFRWDGGLLSSGKLLGPARSSLSIGDKEIIFQQTSRGLMMSDFEAPDRSSSQSIITDNASEGSYVSSRVINSMLYVAFLNEETGVLSLASRKIDGSSFQIEVVDGEKDISYRGMDIAIFRDHNTVGLIYLDAWELKTRMARKQNGVWTSEELPYMGAVGFYTQILEETDDSITFASHNFRSTFNKIDQTFEDLAIAQYFLKS